MSTPATWVQILESLQRIKQEFDRSYKCLNKTNLPSKKTQIKHLQNLVYNHNSIVGVLKFTYATLTPAHKIEVEQFFKTIKTRLEVLFGRLQIPHEIPAKINQILDLRFAEPLSDEDGSEEETDEPPTPLPFDIIRTMAPSALDSFVGNASKLVPDFDGKLENLQKFLDALDILELIKAEHETVAVAIVKSKLDVWTRGFLTTESTILQIKETLAAKVKGQPTKAIVAKLLNTKQGNKSANDFVKEIEELAKTLERSYISDGVPAQVVKTYFTESAIKSLTTNGKADQCKLLMKGVVYNTFSDAVSKFVELSDDNTATVNIVRQGNYNRYNSRGRGNYHGNYQNNRGRNGRNYNNSRNQRNNRGYQNNQNNGRQARNRNQRNGQQNQNVRAIEAASGNGADDPQEAQLRILQAL